MCVLKLENIKSYEADLKQLLSIDKKYMPIQKKLAAVLRSLNPSLQKVQGHIDEINKIFIQKSLQINRHYAENMDNFQRSLNALIQKNQDDIEKSKKLKHQQTHDLNTNLKAQLETIDEKLVQINLDANEKLEKADQSLKRELSQIYKIMQDARKVYQETTQRIELEKIESTELYLRRYEQSVVEFDQKEEQLKTAIQGRRDLIKEDAQQASKTNDGAYLTIKNTYSQLSISLNKKINELKKKYQSALAVLEKEHQERLKPIMQSIDELKMNYQDAQRKSLQNYTEKMSSLNVIFDVQKSAYESKKDRIIHEGNDAITLLNSKLSTFKETTQKDKLSKAREMRDDIKSLEDEKDRIDQTKILNQMLNQFDNDLNKQILRTNRDIINKKKETQKKLYELDQKHLREINEWRLKKVLYEYEKKQDFAKIDLNYNHNLSASELMQKSEDLTYTYQKEMLLQQHNMDLLPLEFQLSIAAAVQERELNLLANDAHVTIASFKHAEALLDYEQKKEITMIELTRHIEKTRYEADLRVLNASTQLELEKEKIKRDYTLAEQELRIELQNALYNKQKQAIDIERKDQITALDLERDVIYLDHKRTLDSMKRAALSEEYKRIFIVNEGRYKHQQRMSNEKAIRLLSTYQNELENNQMRTEDFFEILFMFYQTDRFFKDTMTELYHLPSHPEVFKGLIGLVKKQTEDFLKSFFIIVEDYQRLDQEFYIAKIEDMTGYKYMLKHEDMMNYYDAETQKVKSKIKAIDDDIKGIEEQFFLAQGDLERHQLAITQLQKSIEQTRHQEKTETKHHDIKEFHKDISNREHEMKRIKQRLTRLQKTMDQKHLQIGPLEDEIERIKKKQADEEKILETNKRREGALFYRYLTKNQRLYEHLTRDVRLYHEALMAYYHALFDEVYVSDAFLKEKEKTLQSACMTFEKHIIERHQGLMNVMLAFYQKNKKEQYQITMGFKKSTLSLMRSLKISHARQLEDLNRDASKQQKDLVQQEKTLRMKSKKQSELDRLTYRKSLLIDQNTLKVIEKRISENLIHREEELKLINENQNQTAQQYSHEYELKVQEIQKDADKSLLSLDQSIQAAIKNHTSLDESIVNKNEAILAKYQVNHEKSLLSLKQKTEHINEVIAKLTKNQQIRLNEERLVLKHMNTKREHELKNIQEHMLRFNKQTKRSQNHGLNKEFVLLRKTHASKMKMLHLN